MTLLKEIAQHLQSLHRLARTTTNPFDDVMDYANPATAGSILPMMSCQVQMLRPGEKTKPLRHASTSICFARQRHHADQMETRFIGKRATVSSYRCDHGTSTLIAQLRTKRFCFRCTTRPILRAFRLYREEGKEEDSAKKT